MFLLKYVTGRAEIEAIRDWCDAGSQISQWFDDNPGCHIGDYEDGRQLVKTRICTYVKLKALQNKKVDETYIDFNLKLLERSPVPPPPRKRRGVFS